LVEEVFLKNSRLLGKMLEEGLVCALLVKHGHAWEEFLNDLVYLLSLLQSKSFGERLLLLEKFLLKNLRLQI
jgi:hypothetical protein